MKKKNKKSQLYIITALFLISLVFLMSVRTQGIKESDIDFKSLHENFVDEGKHVLNSAIYLRRNMTEDFSDFADTFIEYAGTEGVNMNVFYGIIYDNRVYLANKLGEPANITTSTINFILTDDNQSSRARENWLNAEIGSTDYLFNTSRDIVRFFAVTRMSYENRTEVRTYG